jgi:amino-acid N-acetyltransferase
VLHIPGQLLEWSGFPSLMEDIALTWLLGMKIVIVVGCRYQVNMRLEKLNKATKDTRSFSLRVTDNETMRIIEEGNV